MPMIQFRYGANRSGSATHALKEHKSDSNTVKSVGAISQTKAVEHTDTFEFSETPTKYRRRQLTQEEIDLIAIGGSI
ncbi:hypothetical protein I4U23_014296 [Adineta vaga]|nr:hypothetical protein I4U23_014296 [Adineta vaga]